MLHAAPVLLPANMVLTCTIAIAPKAADGTARPAGAVEDSTAGRLRGHAAGEPLGGAHRNPQEVASRLKEHLLSQLKVLDEMPADELIQARYDRLMAMGAIERE